MPSQRSFRRISISNCCRCAGFSDKRTRAHGRVNREQLAEIDLHWHDLRHEAACRWLAKGLDLRAIQLLLGHADLKTTQRYLNVTDEELRRTMHEKLWTRRAAESSPDGLPVRSLIELMGSREVAMIYFLLTRLETGL